MPAIKMRPVEREIRLPDIEVDGDILGDMTITVRQARQGDIMAINALMDEQVIEYQYGEDGKPVSSRSIQKLSGDKIVAKRVYRTLIGCNLTVDEDEGKNWFTFKETDHGVEPGNENRFMEAWGSLNPAIAEAIYKGVCEVNPNFRFYQDAE